MEACQMLDYVAYLANLLIAAEMEQWVKIAEMLNKDGLPLWEEIFEELKCCAVSNISRKISNIVELMKLAALVEDFPPEPDRIHLSNGTLFLDGTFVKGRLKIVRNRFLVAYNPNAPKSVLWL